MAMYPASQQPRIYRLKLGIAMSKTIELPVAEEKAKTSLPVVAAPESMCVEFVQFCKEQHLEARAAQTFLHVLHRHSWETERDRIREGMRPEVDALFAPAEKALAEGKDCKELLNAIIKDVRTHK
jgi:hypothetical protein